MDMCIYLVVNNELEKHHLFLVQTNIFQPPKTGRVHLNLLERNRLNLGLNLPSNHKNCVLPHKFIPIPCLFFLDVLGSIETWD